MSLDFVCMIVDGLMQELLSLRGVQTAPFGSKQEVQDPEASSVVRPVFVKQDFQTFYEI